MNSKTWNIKFTPSYTPEEMLKLGVFEGKYVNGIKGIPASWKVTPKVLGPKDEPDPKLNKFGVKSRQPLSVWKEKGWTTKESPLGWFEWYCLYYLGRRLDKEDDWQIGRWNSFVARHQGQIKANCSLTDDKCRPVQRQALLQWSWDSSTLYNDKQRQKNLKQFTDQEFVAKESFVESANAFVLWND